MLTYANRMRKLVLPQYGRNIQQMVDHCMTIEDREQRNLCAQTIIDSMLTLFPATGDAEEYRRKLWDHLLIMSDFKLDVDTPYEHVDPTVFEASPDPVPIFRYQNIPQRHYGANIQALIQTASELEESEEREALVYMIANQMKKTLCAEYGDAEDERVFADLRLLSHGAINIKPEEMMLQDYKIAPAPGKKKKKK